MNLWPDVIGSSLKAHGVLQHLLDAHRNGHPDPGVPLPGTVERLRGWLHASEQEATEEGFGLFDDTPINPARETADDDALGFLGEGPGAPEQAAVPETSGFFGETLGAPIASRTLGPFDDASDSPPTKERASGLFDGASGSPAAPSAPAQTIAAPARGAVAPVCGDGESGPIQVSMEKIDSLVNLVGKLMIAQTMFGQLNE